MVYIEVKGTRYPAEVFGHSKDATWDNRESLYILTEMTQTQATELFENVESWSLIDENVQDIYELDEGTGESIHTQEIFSETYDKSEYDVLGDIITHRNGKITIKMGKPTAQELISMLEEDLL